MNWSYERVYVLECRTPDHFYVGTTLREMSVRQREHEAGYGSRWTHRHGVKRVMFDQIVPTGTSGTLENDLTKHLMSVFGWGRVRGGDYVFVRCQNRDWLPLAGPRDVLPLHLRPVSKFAPELRGLVNAFELSRCLHDSDQLYPDPLPEPLLCGSAQKEHHVLPAHPVAVPLGAN